MATTITGAPEAGGNTERVALQAVAGNAEAVTLPEWVRRCTVQFFDSGMNAAAGKFLRGQTQADGAAMSAHAFSVSSGAADELTLATGGRVLGGATIYLSGAAAGYCSLDLEA